MKKRGQLTIFIILAILIVVILGVLIAFKIRDSQFGKETISPQAVPIYSFVEDCVKQTAEDSIYYIGSTGGYFTNNLSTESNIAYYLYEKKNYIPLKEQVEKELAKYMNEMLFFCTRDFIDFPDFQVNQEKISSDVKILDGKVVFNIKYPLSITKDNKTYVVSKFDNKEIPVRLNVVYDAAKEIMDEQMKHREDICINCLGKIGDEKDLYVDMYDYDKNIIIFEITDKNSNINGEDLKFSFANKY